MRDRGAYILHLRLLSPVRIRAGALAECLFNAGHYLYVGSARRGIAARVARHRRLAEFKTGPRRWHIDYLLSHPRVRLLGASACPGRRECDLSRTLARSAAVSVPAPRFGSSDCRAGCRAHLYRLGDGAWTSLRSQHPFLRR